MYWSSGGEYLVVRNISKKIYLDYIINEKMCILLVLIAYVCISKCTVRKTVKNSSTLSLSSSLDGLHCQRHAPAALPPGETRYPFYRRLGWPQFRSGRVREILPPPGFDPRTVHHVASHYTDCPRKGIWLLYHVLRQVENGTELLELSYVL